MQHYQRVFPPFQVSELDIENTSLEPCDLGEWALLITGCYQLCDSEASAWSVYQFLKNEEPMR